MNCIKESGALFQTYVKKCQLIELPGYRHSEISAYHPDEWAARHPKKRLHFRNCCLGITAS